MSRYADPEDSSALGSHERKQIYVASLHRVGDKPGDHGFAMTRTFDSRTAAGTWIGDKQQVDDRLDLVAYDEIELYREGKSWREENKRSLMVPAEGTRAVKAVPDEILERLGKPVEKRGLVHGAPGEVF